MADETVSGGSEFGAPGDLWGADELPEWIGQYRVLDRLGEGGMGVVFLAEQQSPKREVAVKVIRGGKLVGEREIHLFLREAESLARLKHHGIASIYEAGRTEDGRHFFAMERVQGEVLSRFLARGPWPLSDEAVTLRLRLVRKICDAVHYAHQRGVIHRDLKPANVIVTDEASVRTGGVPDVKILDFGLARITDSETEATATAVGTVRGTFAYMSPEQARGDPHEIDLRTDVYALGVILYELLSGRKPFDLESKSVLDILKIIHDEQPRPLREIWGGAGRFDADLETIVRKAMEKDPNRRYDSAAALSDDIERYLTLQPIQARPASTAYQFRKFAARNRILVGGIAATAVALVGGVVVSTNFGLREAAQRREAERAKADLETVVDFQAGILSRVDPSATGEAIVQATRDVLAASLRSRGRDQEEVDRALGVLTDTLAAANTTDVARRVLHENVLAPAAAAAAAEFADRPAIEAQLLETLAKAYQALGMAKQAEPAARRALDLRRAGGGDEDPATLRASVLVGGVLIDLGRLDEADTMLAAALETLRTVAGPDAPDTLQAMQGLGMSALRGGKFDRSEPLLAEVLAGQTRVLGPDAGPTLSTMDALAGTYYSLGRHAEAEAMYSEALERRRRTLGSDARSSLGTMNNLANVRLALGRPAEAEALLREAFEGYRARLGEAHPTTTRVIKNLAQVAERLGRPDDAEALYRQVIAVRESQLGRDHPDTLWALNDYAAFLAASGRPGAARAILDDLMGRARRVFGPESTTRAQMEHTYAEMLLADHDFPGAKSRLERVLEVYERHGSMYLGLAWYQHAQACAGEGDRSGALASLGNALAKGYGKDTWKADAAFSRYRDDPAFVSLGGGAS